MLLHNLQNKTNLFKIDKLMIEATTTVARCDTSKFYIMARSLPFHLSSIDLFAFKGKSTHTLFQEEEAWAKNTMSISLAAPHLLSLALLPK